VTSVPSLFGPAPAAAIVASDPWKTPVEAPVSSSVTCSVSPVISLTTVTWTVSGEAGSVFGSESFTDSASVSPGELVGVIASAASSPPTIVTWSVRSSEALVGSEVSSSR
jgi:hypothetical protein